jgi:iron complex transport system ATP-binding protein
MSNKYEFRKISAAYNGRQVLSDVSCSIKQGDFISIVGPNGAGKSTLLKLMVKLLSPSSGEIIFSGQPLSGITPRELALSVGYLPQATNVIFSLSCFDMVMIGRTPHLRGLMLGEEKDRKIVEKVMQDTDCLQFAERDFNSISAGEKQRVLIARALASEPDVLLLDEPAASLDIEHAVMIYNLLASLNRRDKITLVVVSHNLNFTSRYSGGILLLKEGKIIKKGRPSAVLREDVLRKLYGDSFILIKTGRGSLPVIVPKKENG